SRSSGPTPWRGKSRIFARSFVARPNPWSARATACRTCVSLSPSSGRRKADKPLRSRNRLCDQQNCPAYEQGNRPDEIEIAPPSPEEGDADPNVDKHRNDTDRRQHCPGVDGEGGKGDRQRAAGG